MTLNERIDLIRSDQWIAFDRATIVLNRLTSLMEMPRQSRMPGLMVYGSSGIGKTMIAKRMEGRYPATYDARLGVTKTPLLLVQAPPAPDERRFYQHILATLGAPMWGRHTVSELEVRALGHLRDMDLKMLMIDEVVIPPFLMGSSRRIHAAVFSFMAGVMPPMPMLGRSLL